MSNFCSITAGGGKTRASRSFSFQTNFDRMLACCVVGGRQDEMFVRKNPSHTGANSILYLEKVPDVLSSKPQADRNLKVKLLNLLTRGAWFAEYCNGSYVDSTLRPAIVNEDPKTFNGWKDLEMWHFTDAIKMWKNGSLDSCVFDAPNSGLDLRFNTSKVNNEKLEEYDFLIVRYEGVVRTFITLKRIASTKRYEFDGLPLLSMIEGAVQAPKNVHLPFYNVMSDDMSRLLLQVPAKTAAEALNAVMSNKNDWTDISKQISKVPRGGRLTNRINAAALGSQNQSKNIDDLLAAVEKYNILATDSDLYTIDPAKVNVSEDFVRYTNLWNRIIDEPCLVRTNAFNFSRCFIDSLSNLEIEAAGNTLSNGISGAYVSGLQQTTMSEAIILRADGGDKETLNKIAWEGKINGLVLSDVSGRWASLNDYYVTSRDENAIDRNILYPLVVHDGRKIVSYGNHGIRTEGPTSITISVYSNAYDGRFTETHTNITSRLLVLLPSNYEIKSVDGKVNLNDTTGRVAGSTASRFSCL